MKYTIIMTDGKEVTVGGDFASSPAGILTIYEAGGDQVEVFAAGTWKYLKSQPITHIFREHCDCDACPYYDKRTTKVTMYVGND
jgi:hypothetical protein